MNLIIEIEEQSEAGFVVRARIPRARLNKQDYLDRGHHLYKKRYVGELDFLIETNKGPWKGWARSCYSFVAGSFRNRGIATRMYFAGLAHVKALGLKGIYSLPSMRICDACDAVWKKLKTGRKNNNDIFDRM